MYFLYDLSIPRHRYDRFFLLLASDFFKSLKYLSKSDFLMYKDKPLVRKGNTIYYGNMSDPYVVLLQIVSSKKVNDLDVADKVTVQLLTTDPDARPKDRIIKKSEKKGLYQAMDIGSIWLELALKGNK